MTTSVVYAYGFVRAGFDAAGAPPGLEDAPVRVVTGGDVGALVSDLPANAYSAAAVEQHGSDVSWVSPRATAHDLVLTWAQEHGGVLPLTMFSLWTSDESLRTALGERASNLAEAFARVRDADEFGVRMHRRDAVLADAVARLDPELASLAAEAERASPGQRYLLERKLAGMKTASARRTSQRLAREAHERLATISREAVIRPLPAQADPSDTTLVLNGAYLVDRSRRDEFRATVAALIREHEAVGMAFDFTGPWPPYNFSA